MLFDETGEKGDKFSTKPVDARYGKKSYVFRWLGFSPDGPQLTGGKTHTSGYCDTDGEAGGEKDVGEK